MIFLAIRVVSRMRKPRARPPRRLAPAAAHRGEPCWEVVDHKVVLPVLTLEDDEDIDIIRLNPSDTRATYVFESRTGKHSGARSALIFARQQLMQELAKTGCNAFLREGWQLTVLRKGERHRIEVQYQGRGALTSEEVRQPLPPFLDLLGKE